jgi:hypothetical protein
MMMVVQTPGNEEAGAGKSRAGEARAGEARACEARAGEAGAGETRSWMMMVVQTPGNEEAMFLKSICRIAVHTQCLCFLHIQFIAFQWVVCVNQTMLHPLVCFSFNFWFLWKLIALNFQWV